MYCPECLSDEITQISDESVRYDVKNSKVEKISFDSEYISFGCRECEHEFYKDEARTIMQQVAGAWRYLCKKFKWSEDEDIEYKALLRNRNRVEWDDLFKHIWKEQLDKGHIEWKWRLSYTSDIFGKTPHDAIIFLKKQNTISDSLGLEEVKWTSNWNWVNKE